MTRGHSFDDGDRLFCDVAQRHRIKPPPSIVFCSEADWLAYCRSVWRHYPPWAYDSDYVEEAARDFLPRVLADMGVGTLIGGAEMAADTPILLAVTDAVLAADPERIHAWLAFRIEPAATDVLLLEDASHAWRCPALAARGEGLIELGAWRWRMSPARAAWRIARLSGLPRPVP